MNIRDIQRKKEKVLDKIVPKYSKSNYVRRRLLGSGTSGKLSTNLTAADYRELLLNKRNVSGNTCRGHQKCAPSHHDPRTARSNNVEYSASSNSKYDDEKPIVGTRRNTSIATTITTRLRIVEKALNEANEKIKEKSFENEALRREIKDYKVIADGAKFPNEIQKRMLELSNRNADLERKVREMEYFLKTSGLEWTGYEKRNKVKPFSTEGRRLGGSNSTENIAPQVMKIDFNLLVKRIKELNAVAGEGTKTVSISRGGAASLCKRESLPLILYRYTFLWTFSHFFA